MNPQRTYTMGARADAVAATKERIARTALDLFLEQAFEDVTLAAIAAAAGVSHQTVLNHFESKEGVVNACIEILRDETVDNRSRARPGDLHGAIRFLVGEYERMGDANVRWALTADRYAQLAAALAEGRANHQEWIVLSFGDRLPTASAARRRAINAVHAATDVYTWKLLRRDLGLSRIQTEKTMADLVIGVLRGEPR